MAAPRIYLAGPEVFLPDPLAIGHAKRQLCARYGFDGRFPLDAELRLGQLSGKDKGYAISAANEALIRSCHALIANMTPYRGPSTDAGTAFEMGFARALEMPVYAYTNAPGNFRERTVSFLKGAVYKRSDGSLEDSQHMFIENHNLVDNLMLDGAVHASGGTLVVNPTAEVNRYTDLRAFEICLQMATERLKPHRSAEQ